jgi:hypothetical protein
MTSCQAQTCTHHLNNIQGSIHHKLWGGWRRILRWRWCWCWGWWIWCCTCDGDAPPYTKEESVVKMAVIYLRRHQQINPSRGGRRIPHPPPPQKIMEKIGHPFSVETKAYIRRRRRGDGRGANRPSRPCHPCPFGPRGLPHVLPPLQMFLVVKYWRWPWNNKIQKQDIFCLLEIKYR